MSMNHAEIDVVLNELALAGSHVQQIWQPRFDTIIMDFSKEDTTTRVLFCTRPGFTRIHRTSIHFPTKASQPRFSVFLRANLKGAYVEKVEQYGKDRIVVFTCKYEGEEVFLLSRLWGTAGNVFLCDGAFKILDCAFRRPAKGELGGEFFVFPQSLAQTRDFSPRPRVVEGDFNASMDFLYSTEEKEERLAIVSKQCEKLLDSLENRALSRLAALNDQHNKIQNLEQYRHYGDLIMAWQHTITPGARQLVCEDWENPGNSISIPLDPTLPVRDQAGKWYGKYQKARDSQDWILQGIDDQKRLLSLVETYKLKTKVAKDIHEFTQIIQECQALAPSKTSIEPEDSEKIGARFLRHGFLLIVGRNATENDELLRRHVRGNDLWFHARDWPGSYVFIKVPKEKTVPLEVLLDAAHLALWYSKGRDAGSADCYYTQVKHLRRAKNGPKGLVLPSHEKNILVKTDPERMKEILQK